MLCANKHFIWMNDIHDRHGKANMHTHSTGILQNALSNIIKTTLMALINSQLMHAVKCSAFWQIYRAARKTSQAFGRNVSRSESLYETEKGTKIVNALHFMHSDGCSAGIRNSRWDPIIRQTRTPPPGFHSSSVYHMALSSWAPLTDNERRQPVQLQAKHSAFYRPKHVSGKLTMSIQFFSAFNTHHNASATVPWPLHTTVLLKTLAWDDKNSRNITGSKWGKLNLQSLWHEKFILTCTFFSLK